MENNVKERAMEIIKPWIEAPSMNANGINTPVDNNVRNTLRGMSYNMAMKSIISNPSIKAELKANPDLADAVIELVEKETAPLVSEYVLTERFPKIKNR